MLYKLQDSVETEEVNWKSKLAEKTAKMEDLQRELEAVVSKNEAMEASLNCLNSAEEVKSNDQ